MKFLVAFSALLAVAAALPAENARVKRGVFGFGGHGYLGHAGFGDAVVAGPSGIISTHGAPAHGLLAHGYLAAPAHGYLAAPAHGAPGAISTHTETAGVINAPSATLIGPSTDGHPGAIIPKGPTAFHGYDYAHGHAYKAALWG